MANRNFIEDNDAARQELAEVISHLDERSFALSIGSAWTISSLLCHIAFWDQRVLDLLKQWQSGPFEPSWPSAQQIHSINAGVKAIALAVPGPAAAKLALDSAAAVDAEVSHLTDELAGNIASAGLERYLRRSLHRREHLQRIREALGAQL